MKFTKRLREECVVEKSLAHTVKIPLVTKRDECSMAAWRILQGFGMGWSACVMAWRTSDWR
jgi:hypothetical protein